MLGKNIKASIQYDAWGIVDKNAVNNVSRSVWIRLCTYEILVDDNVKTVWDRVFYSVKVLNNVG